MDTLRDNLIGALQQTASHKDAALASLSTQKAPLLQAICETDLDPWDISQAIAKTLKIDRLEDLSEHKPSAWFVKNIPIHFARQHGVIGLTSDNGTVPVAVDHLTDWNLFDVLSRRLNKPVQPVLAKTEHIRAAIGAAYQERTGQAETLIQELDRSEVLQEVKSLEGREDLLDVDSRPPVIKLVNLILFEAVKQGASDLHVQPYEQTLMVRMRIDGILFDSFELSKQLQDEIISRLKVMGKMNIAEKRQAQDGRATVQVGDRLVDLRIASLPTSFGERIVIRLLDKSARLYTLNELGMEKQTLARFEDLLAFEHGLILVTGPTGSGKTTTLYAALQQLNHKEMNIITLEDPIEYQLPGISQTQINIKKDMTFARGLRSVLRQDPDIIMVGEIRDHETATMAIQSALTGHLVFSTLHTNDAASAVTRLLDLGVEPYLVASSVIGVLAQRLVRRVCPQCKQAYSPEQSELNRLGIDRANDLYRGVGCDACRNTGYRGRVGIFELLAVNKSVRQHIQARETAEQIKQAAIGNNMKTLRDDGISRVHQHLTTIDEVLRVTVRSSEDS